MSCYRYLKNKIQSKLDCNFWNEHKKKFGNRNSEQTFYVIRREDKNVGLFSMYTYILGHIKYAIKRNWIPIVDMENYLNIYTDIRHKGKKNSWEYFFKQPCGEKYTLSEIYKSKHVILGSSIIPDDMPNISMDFMGNASKIKEWHDLAAEYILYNDDINMLIDDECIKLFGTTTPKNILGVLLRGTDYVALRPKNHPIQPTYEEAVNEVKNLMRKYNCSTIYLSTEDISLLEGMKKEFGDRLIYSDVLRYEHNISGYLSEYNRKRKEDYYQKGIDYIVPMGILTRCCYLFAGRTSGSVAVIVMSQILKESVLWDRGCY